jgi:predicted nucleic acid-binding Zn ribbon protein
MLHNKESVATKLALKVTRHAHAQDRVQKLRDSAESHLMLCDAAHVMLGRTINSAGAVSQGTKLSD